MLQTLSCRTKPKAVTTQMKALHSKTLDLRCGPDGPSLESFRRHIRRGDVARF